VAKILIVDDDPLQVNLLVEIFSINHYSAFGAQSGTEALAFHKKEHFDLILSDIRMPGMDGVELCRKIKQIDQRTNVILTTAYADDELILEGIKAGALITMSKPLEIDQLFNQIAFLSRK
jgi:two-component system, response regulator, stage 0 sporulation protein F